MTGSIDWKKITPRMKVVRVYGKHPDRWTGKPNSRWEAGGKTVTFGSHDQRQAQAWLDKRVRSDAQRFGRKK
jgi:hypothetical protein